MHIPGVFLSIHKNALLIGWAFYLWSWDHTFIALDHFCVLSCIQAISEEAFLGSLTSLLVFDRFAKLLSLWSEMNTWVMSTDVHFLENCNTCSNVVWNLFPFAWSRIFYSAVKISSLGWTFSGISGWKSWNWITHVVNSLWWIEFSNFVPNAWSGTISSGKVLPTGAVYLSIHCECRGWTEGNWRNKPLASRPDALTLLITRLLVQLRKAGWSKLIPIVSGWWMAEVVLEEWSINIDLLILGNC
jgi:hypothetical protein